MTLSVSVCGDRVWFEDIHMVQLMRGGVSS